MASWSSRRKSFFGFSFLIIVALAVGIPTFKLFYITPTCFDGKQNQNETGVDCGGKCARVCSSSFLSPRVEWSRADKISEGVYNLGAYITNPNLDGTVRSAEYLFKVYDKDARLIGERTGYVYIPPHKNTIAFQSGILTKESIPKQVTFEFVRTIEWGKTAFQNDGIIVSNKLFTNDDHSARLTATLQNTTLSDYGSFDVFAVLYDEDKNELGFSKTRVDFLKRNSSVRIEFTWPSSKVGVLTTEIIPNVNVFK